MQMNKSYSSVESSQTVSGHKTLLFDQGLTLLYGLIVNTFKVDWIID